MKNHFFAKCLLFALALPVMACGGGEDEDPTPPIDPTPPKPVASITITGEAASGLNFTSEGGSKKITFTATADWTVAVASTGSAPWCSVSPSKGTSSQTSVSVTVEPNTGYDDRSVSVNFTCGTQRKTVVVTQKQKDALLVTSDKVEMDNKGGSFTSEVKANISYTVTIPSQFAGWISAATSRALKTSTETFNVAANENFENREGYVVFSGAGIEERVNVYQAGGARLLLSAAETTVDARGGSVKAELQSNCDFTVEMPDAQWIRKDESRAMSSHTVYFTVDENATTDDREAQIRFVSVDRSITETLKVVQRGNSIIITGDAVSGLNFTSEGGSKAITFMAADNWSVEVASTGSTPWCSVSPTSGTSAQTSVSVTVEPNTEYDDRSVSVNFTCGSQRKTVVVTQKQKDALLLTSDKVEMDNNGGTFTSEVKANIKYTVEIPGQFAEWISAVTTRGLTTSTETFNVAANENFESREGYVVFSGAGIEERVSVYQAGGAKLLLSAGETSIDARGGTVKAELQSNCDFTVEMPDVQWIHKDESRAMSSHTVYFTVDENVTTDDRETQIRFVSVDRSVTETLKVVQRAKGAVVLTNKNIEVPVGGGVYQVEYASNMQVAYEILDGADSWISETEASRAMTKANLWFKVKNNLTSSPRTGRVVLHAADARDIADTVTFQQEASIFEITSMTPESVTFKDAAAHDIAIDIKTNLEYSIDKPRYVTLVSDPEDKEHLKFHIAMNDNAGASRSSYISFFAGTRVLATIPVGQEAPKVTMTDDSYQVDYKGGALSMKLTTNINISVKVETGGADWVKVTPASGDALVDAVEIAENTTEEERSCTLTLTAGAFWSQSVVVRQSKAPSEAGGSGVTIPEGGNLSDLLSQEEAMQIESLQVGGEVTATDINFILRMASEGKLTELDLENATIKASSEYYDDPYYNIPGLSGIFTFRISKDNMIGEHMFAKTKLTSIKLPANTVEIGREAFMYSNIAEIVVPDKVKVMGIGTFQNCGNLKKATLPGSLEEVPQDCFYGAKNLEYVTLGEGTKVIGKGAFGSQNNSNLREVTLPSTLTTIKDEAFMFSGIERITLPESMVNYGATLFYDCKRLKKVVMKGVPADGVLPDGTFRGCTALAELKLPEGLTVIGENALYQIATPALTLPSTLKELRRGALYGCEATSLVIPEGVETLGEMALCQMVKLAELTLPSTIRTIGDKLLSSTTLPLTKFHCRMAVPPVPAGPLVKDGFDFGACTLYVPKGSADAYRAAQYWSSFTNIQEE